MTTEINPPDYALISWGGAVAGQKIRTKLARREKMQISKDVMWHNVRPWLGNRWAKAARWIPDNDVFHIWTEPPNRAMLKHARRKHVPVYKPVRL